MCVFQYAVFGSDFLSSTSGLASRMKYCVDKDSPSNWDQPDEVYEILSKPTRQGLARANEAKRAATLLDFQ